MHTNYSSATNALVASDRTMSTRRPDLPRSATFGRPPPQRGPIDTTQPPPMTAPNPRGKTPDPFLMRVVVMVDDATEPGITDAVAEKHRKALVNVVMERDHGLPSPTTAIRGGQAVAFALRKRLKSDDEVAVLNTLTLLDELMRTVPYFYRYIANEKFFRRLWRFVVPDYKNGMKSMIPIFGKPKIHPGMRGHQSEVSKRVMILIRAWAEELSVMFSGRYDPSAGFLIERYNNKKAREKFPEVPRTPRPWVCPVNSSAYLRRRDLAGYSARASGSRDRDPTENMTLAEVENTANLFANLVDNASSISDLKEELCTDLATRCKGIENNLSKMSMNMSKEEELARAIAVSETLQKALGVYKSSLENGHIMSTIPTIDSISLHSDDEGFDRPQRQTSTRSLDRYGTGPSRPRYDDSSEFSSGSDWRTLDRERDRDKDRDRDRERERDRDLERERERGRERDRERQKEAERERANRERELERANRERELERANREREKEREREERDRERERERGRERARDSRSRSFDDREKHGSRPTTRRTELTTEGKPLRQNSTEKRSRKPPTKPPMSRREKSDSDLQKMSDGRKLVKKDGLIDVPAVDESSEDEEQAGGESFTMLAERYASTKARKQKTRSVSRGKTLQPPPKPAPTGSDPAPSTSAQSLPTPGMMNSNPAAMYQSIPGMGYSPMTVPNMYAMYGSVSHVPMQDPLGLMGAYQTVNPAMYYQSVNPQLYSMASVPGIPSMPALQAAPQESPQQQLPTSPPRAQPPTQPAASVSVSSAYPSNTPQPQAIPSNVPPQNALTGAASQQMVPMSNPGSFYGSVPGVSPGMPSAMQPGMPLTHLGSGVPGVPGMTGVQGVMGGGMLRQAPSGTQEAGAQAAAYQTAMHQAAVAFNAAATMYRSVSGQQPIAAQAGAQPQPGMPAPPTTVDPAEEEERK